LGGARQQFGLHRICLSRKPRARAASSCAAAASQRLPAGTIVQWSSATRAKRKTRRACNCNCGPQPFSTVCNGPMQDTGCSRVQCAYLCGPYTMVVRIKESVAVSKLWRGEIT
jgi:hypothetical protein